MKSWNKKNEVKEISKLINMMDSIAEQSTHSQDHTYWLMKVFDLLERNFGKTHRYFQSLAALTWQARGGTILPPYMNAAQGVEVVDHRAFLQDLDTAKGILNAAKEKIESAICIEDIYKEEGEHRIQINAKPRVKRKRLFWKIMAVIGGLLAALAAIVTVLQFFGVTSFESLPFGPDDTAAKYESKASEKAAHP